MTTIIFATFILPALVVMLTMFLFFAVIMLVFVMSVIFTFVAISVIVVVVIMISVSLNSFGFADDVTRIALVQVVFADVVTGV